MMLISQVFTKRFTGSEAYLVSITVNRLVWTAYPSVVAWDALLSGGWSGWCCCQSAIFP